jgi:hypothetical protein
VSDVDRRTGESSSNRLRRAEIQLCRLIEKPRTRWGVDAYIELEQAPKTSPKTIAGEDRPWHTPNTNFVRAGSLKELKAKGRLVVHGAHRPILVVYDKGRVFP